VRSVGRTVYRDCCTDIRGLVRQPPASGGASRILPAWFVVSETGGVISDATLIVVAPNAGRSPRQGRGGSSVGAPARAAGRSSTWSRTTDVLDTWFSQRPLPFSTWGWPMRRRRIWPHWYPTSVAW